MIEVVGATAGGGDSKSNRLVVAASPDELLDVRLFSRVAVISVGGLCGGTEARSLSEVMTVVEKWSLLAT